MKRHGANLNTDYVKAAYLRRMPYNMIVTLRCLGKGRTLETRPAIASSGCGEEVTRQDNCFREMKTACIIMDT